MKKYKINKCFFATIVPGLEMVLADEIKELGVAAETITIERGKVFFQADRAANQLFRLRCADNIYSIIAEFPVGLHKIDLMQFAIAFGKLRWNGLFNAIDIETKKIIVSASRKGKHTYSRFDVEGIAEDTLIKMGYIKAVKGEKAMQIRIDMYECLCRISIKLTDAKFRYRGNIHICTAAGIRPTIAAALIRISNPSPKDVFYDMFCGSGTIPKEREAFPVRRILASDINEAAVLITKENCGGNVVVFCCDARLTLAKPESVDIIVSNPPWGKQIPVENAKQLYIDFFREAKRILKAEGKMILLTNCQEEVKTAAYINKMQYDVLYNLSLHGLQPKIYIVRQKE